jgi:hypothetical protein
MVELINGLDEPDRTKFKFTDKLRELYKLSKTELSDQLHRIDEFAIFNRKSEN